MSHKPTVVFDDDNPEWTEADFARARPASELPPELAAPMAAAAEHLFPLLILIGLGTRFSALALLGMTLVIQILVYPGAYATHGTWAAVFLYLMVHGPGAFSVDHWIAGRHGGTR